MHGGFGGGGGGFGHSGGGGGGYGHSGYGHDGGHSHNSGHSGGHSGGHEHPMAQGGNHAMHMDHHHHAGAKDEHKGAGASGKAGPSQGQSLLSHATSLVQNGQGILGHIAAALTGHAATIGHTTATGHTGVAGAGQGMHLSQYLSPLQAEKEDSSDDVDMPGGIANPDNLDQSGMVIRSKHKEPRMVLFAVFAGLLIWMLVVQLCSGGAPGRHKIMAKNPLLQSPLPLTEQDMAANSSVGPLLSLLSMAEPHARPSGIAKALVDDPNSDPNEATQTDASPWQASQPDDARESGDNDSRYEKEQADLRGENQADSQKSDDSSAQLAAAMQIFQTHATAGNGATTQSAMVAPASTNPLSMRSISPGAPVNARLTARPMGRTQTIQTKAPTAAASNLLQAETLQKSAQETFAAGNFGGPRALSSDEPILVGTQSKVPGASSVLRVQKPGAAVAVAPTQTQTLLSAAHSQTDSNPASFANLFVPASRSGSAREIAPAQLNSTRRRWRASQINAGQNIISARNSTIADASIYTNGPVDESGHSRKRVLTDR